MAKFTPVDFDPFATGPKLTPVDYDPFKPSATPDGPDPVRPGRGARGERRLTDSGSPFDWEATGSGAVAQGETSAGGLLTMLGRNAEALGRSTGLGQGIEFIGQLTNNPTVEAAPEAVPAGLIETGETLRDIGQVRQEQIADRLIQSPDSLLDDPIETAKFAGQQLIMSGGPTVAGLGASYLGAPAIGLGIMGAVAGGQKFGDVYEETGDLARANEAAGAVAAFEAIPEMLPMVALGGKAAKLFGDDVAGFVTKLAEESPALKWALTSGAEGASELLTEVGNIAYESLREGKEITGAEAWQRLRDATLVGTTMGAAIGAPIALNDAAQRPRRSPLAEAASRDPSTREGFEEADKIFEQASQDVGAEAAQVSRDAELDALLTPELDSTPEALAALDAAVMPPGVGDGLSGIRGPIQSNVASANPESSLDATAGNIEGAARGFDIPRNPNARPTAASPTPETRAGQPSLDIDPEQRARSAFEKRLASVSEGLPPDRVEKLRELYQERPRDRVTGLYRSEDLTETVDIAHAESGTTPAVYVEMDFGNLNGANKRLGNSGADPFLSKAANMARTELESIGATIGIRKGGDEFGFVVRGVTKDQVDSAMDRVRAKFAAEPDVAALADTPNSKPGRGPGIGIHYGTAALEPGIAVAVAMKSADSLVEERKEGAPYGSGTRQEAGANRPVAGAAPSEIGGDPARDGSVDAAAARGVPQSAAEQGGLDATVQAQAATGNPAAAPAGSSAAPGRQAANGNQGQAAGAERVDLSVLDREIGHIEQGGLGIRQRAEWQTDPNEEPLGEFTGRTGWTFDSDFWPNRPDPLTAAQARKAIKKHGKGMRLGTREQRFIDYAKQTLADRDAEFQEAQAAVDLGEQIAPEMSRLEYLESLRNDGLDASNADYEELRSLDQWIQRAHNAGVADDDILGASLARSLPDQVRQLADLIRESESANESRAQRAGDESAAAESQEARAPEAAAAAEGEGEGEVGDYPSAARAEARPEDDERAGRERDRNLGIRPEQGRANNASDQGSASVPTPPPASGQASFLPELTPQQRIQGEVNARDARRNGTGTNARTDMLAGDGELFAGDRPAQGDVEAPTIDYKGFKREESGDGSFILADGNMRVSVEPMAGGKFQAAFRGAKSSPHLQGIQGAVDWADAYREDGSESSPAVFQRTKNRSDDKDLIATHNTTAAKLRHAIKVGGFAVPSIAVTKKDQAITGFGDITLVGSRDIVDPKLGAKAFGADVYSPRYPSVSLEFTKNMRDRAKAMLASGMKATDAYIEWEEVQKDGPAELQRSAPFMWQFLKDNGVKPTVTSFELPDLAPELMPFVKSGLHRHELISDSAFIDAAWKAAPRAITERAGLDTDGLKSAYASSAAAKVETYKNAERRLGKVDQRATRDALRQQVRDAKLEDKLELAASEFIEDIGPNERIFQGHTNSGKRKYVPHTLDRVVKILKKEMRGGEGFNYGVGSLRAKYTPQFRSIEQMRKEKGRLLTEDEFGDTKKEIDDELSAISDELAPYHDYSDRFGFLDIVTGAFSDAAKMGLPRALSENQFKGVPSEVQQQAAAFLNKLRNLPTAYFEVNQPRAVDLSEFRTAVIPDDSSAETVRMLEKAGLKVSRYPARDDAARKAAVRQSAEAEDIAFQRSTATGLPARSVQSIVNKITADWANAPQIEVIASMADAPKAVRDADTAARKEGVTDDPAGFLHKGTVYIVASAQASPATVLQTVLHEVKGHVGLRGVFGPKLDVVLDRIARTREAQVRAKAEQYGYDFDNENQRRLSAEEVLAEMAESDPSNGMVKRAIAAIKAFLRQVGVLDVNSISNAEIIREYLQPAAAFVERGAGGRDGALSPAFQRQDQAGTLEFKRWSALLGPAGMSDLVQALRDKSVVDGLQRNAKSLTDLLESHPSLSERGSLVDIPRAVVSHVLGVTNNKKVRRAVVAAIPVDVVDFFARKQLSADQVLNNKAVLENVLSIDGAANVSLAVDKASAKALLRSVASQAAELASLADGLFKGFTAELANEGDSVLRAHAKSVTETEAFSKWFGDSKVVDADGKPLVVYHGTRGNFSEFDPLRTGTASDAGWYGSGFYFTPDPLTASSYSANRDTGSIGFETMREGSPDAGANVMPVYLSIQNPYDWRDENSSGLIQNDPEASMRKRAELEAKGHDGVLVYNDFIQIPKDGSLSDAQWDALTAASPIVKQMGRSAVTKLFQNREWSYRELKQAYGVDVAYAMNESRSRRVLMEVAAFRPEQIKSAIGNTGAFDPKDPDIRFRRQGQSNSAKPPSTIGRWWNAYQDRFLDEFASLAQAEAETAKAGIAVTEKESARRSENLRHGRFQDKVRDARREIFEPMAKILGDAKLDREGLADYLWWRHAPERDAVLRAKHKGNPADDALAGISPKEARANIASLPAATREAYEQAAKLVDKLRARTLKVLQDSGQVAPETVEALKSAYEHYVPLRGLPIDADPELNTAGKTYGVGKGLSVNRNPLGKKALGRKSKPSSIIEEMKSDLERALIGAEKQRVLNRLINLMQANPEIGRIDPVEHVKQEVNGIIQYVPKAVTENTVTFLHKGKPVRLKMASPRLERALLNMNETPPAAVRWLAKITRWLSAVKTSLSPYFMLINPVRDAIFASMGVGSEKGVKHLASFAAHYPAAWRAMYRDERAKLKDGKTDTYAREFAKAGGKTGYTHANDIDTVTKDLNRLFTQYRKGDGPKGTAKRIWYKAGDIVEAGNNIAENATRLAVFSAMRENGASIEEAAKYAKDVTVNFNVRGSWGKNINAGYMFFNAAVQGSRRMIQLMKSPAFATTMAGLGIATYAIALKQMFDAGDDDDGESKYLKLVGDWDAQRAIPLRLGDEEYASIPIPYGPNIFSYFGWKAAELHYKIATGKKYSLADSAADVALNLSNSMTPIQVDQAKYAWIPEAASIPVQLMTNANDFGSPISYTEKYRQPGDNSPAYQDADYRTGEVYKLMSQFASFATGGDEYEGGAINLAPEKLRYVSQQGLGGMYRLINESMELGQKMWDGAPIEPRDVPLSNVYLRSRDLSHQQSSAFYENRDDVRELRRIYKTAVEREDDDKQDEMLDEHPWLKGAELSGGTADGRRAQQNTPVGKLREAEREINALRDEMKDAYTGLGKYEGMERKARMAKVRQLKRDIASAQRDFNAVMNDKSPGQSLPKAR